MCLRIIICSQRKLRSASTTAQSDRFAGVYDGLPRIQCFFNRTAKVQVRLHECAGCSECLLGAHVRRFILILSFKQSTVARHVTPYCKVKLQVCFVTFRNCLEGRGVPLIVFCCRWSETWQGYVLATRRSA